MLEPSDQGSLPEANHDVRNIYQADFLFIILAVRNRTDDVIPAGLIITLLGYLRKPGQGARRIHLYTLEEDLAPGATLVREFKVYGIMPRMRYETRIDGWPRTTDGIINE